MQSSFRCAAVAALVLWSPAPALGESAWAADRATGCKVWNEDPQPAETVTWSGACLGGYAEGPGFVQWFEHGQPSSHQEGTFRHGKMNGKGYSMNNDGTRFEGEYRDNMLNGKGVMVVPGSEGGRYVGDFVDDNRDGYGVYTWNNGDRYEGEWRNDKRDGRGIYSWGTGGRYEGEWRANDRHGRGVYVNNSIRKEGLWENDEFTGR